jgi:hypothetical protein
MDVALRDWRSGRVSLDVCIQQLIKATTTCSRFQRQDLDCWGAASSPSSSDFQRHCLRIRDGISRVLGYAPWINVVENAAGHFGLGRLERLRDMTRLERHRRLCDAFDGKMYRLVPSGPDLSYRNGTRNESRLVDDVASKISCWMKENAGRNMGGGGGDAYAGWERVVLVLLAMFILLQWEEEEMQYHQMMQFHVARQ